MFKFLKNRTKLGNSYYLVLFVNRTKPGTVLIETVLSGESLYIDGQNTQFYQWAKKTMPNNATQTHSIFVKLEKNTFLDMPNVRA